MFKHPLRIAVIGAATVLGAAPQALAGGCCPERAPACACAPVVQQVVVPPTEMYVVNQGPVYSGPGSYVTQRNYIEGDQTAPYGYAYVGYIYAETYVGGYRYFYGTNFQRAFVPYGGPARHKRVHARSQPVRALGSNSTPRLVQIAADPRR